MSLMGTLAKLAIGYAAARGVDKMSGGGGIGALFGGAQIAPDDAQADQAPGMGNMQDMMAQMGGGAGMGGVQDMIAQMTKGGGMGNMQEMIANMASQAGFDLSALTGGAPASGEPKGGLLSSTPESGPGLAGVLAALGGAAAMSGQGAGAMIDQFKTSQTVPQAEEAAGLMLRAMIQAAKADGEIDPDEQAKIMETVGADADAEDISFVRTQLAAPIDVEGLAADTPAPLKAQVYSMSLMSIRLDRQSEAEYLDSLARALGLNQQAVNALHLQMGVQPLYS
ncbi:DUF533 domain-containing protein [Microbulbifer sp. S227A]|uniref:DUF533 domain-containing protein n=1 Tax=Microbulbifer sp. S227A TaxID=3415131 RepID=UPI003C7CECAA